MYMYEYKYTRPLHFYLQIKSIAQSKHPGSYGTE